MTTETMVACPQSISGKLVKLLGMVGTVEKKGENKSQHYNFVRETDLVDKVRPAMAELGLFLHQSTLREEMVELYTTQSGSTMWLTKVWVNFTWVDVSGDIWPVPGIFPGHGADTGDKGVYKAMTGAEKYFLMKTFLVGTGDDVEADEKVDQHAAAARASSGPATVRRGSQQGVQRGGKSDVATDAQLKAYRAALEALGVKTADDAMKTTSRLVANLGGDAPTWESAAAFGSWLTALPSAQIGKLIVAAQEPETPAGEEVPAVETEAGADTLDLGYEG